jgi:hypothetical protein
LRTKDINTLKVIENNALRSICRKRRVDRVRISDLHEMASVESLETRLQKLRKEYFRINLINNNELVVELGLDHVNSGGNSRGRSVFTDSGIEELLRATNHLN